MVGRDSEMALADRWLSSGGVWPRSLVFDGLPGIGKTTLLHEVAARAAAGGFRILACQPAQVETKMALAGIGDLLEDVSNGRLSALPAPHRRAIEVALMRAESDGPPPPRLLATAVRTLLAELCAERPLAVAIDDAHWLDGTSSTVLAFALRRLRDARLACLVTRRAGESGGFDPGRLAASPEAVVRATIPALSPEELAAILEERLPRPLTRFALSRIHRAC